MCGVESYRVIAVQNVFVVSFLQDTFPACLHADSSCVGLRGIPAGSTAHALILVLEVQHWTKAGGNVASGKPPASPEQACSSIPGTGAGAVFSAGGGRGMLFPGLKELDPRWLLSRAPRRARAFQTPLFYKKWQALEWTLCVGAGGRWQRIELQSLHLLKQAL